MKGPTRAKNARKLTPADLERLVELLERGYTVAEAADALGVTKQAVYYRLRKDPSLKKRCEEGEDLASNEKVGTFLNYLKTGASLEVACSRSGLSKKYIYKRLGADAAFREKVEDALSIPDLAVERKLLKKALAGNIQAMALWLRQRRPGQWREPK